MNPQPWAYIDVMANPDDERIRIECYPLLKKLLETVEGNMDENDGWFKITLTTGVIIEYKYVFRPHRHYEKQGESYFHYWDPHEDDAIDLGIDTYLLSYADMGFIYGALTMFVEHKLGLKGEK